MTDDSAVLSHRGLPLVERNFALSSEGLWCWRVGIRRCGKTHLCPSQIYLAVRFNGSANPPFKSAEQSTVAATHKLAARCAVFRTPAHFGLALSVATLAFLCDRLMFHCLLRPGYSTPLSWLTSTEQCAKSDAGITSASLVRRHRNEEILFQFPQLRAGRYATLVPLPWTTTQFWCAHSTTLPLFVPDVHPVG